MATTSYSDDFIDGGQSVEAGRGLGWITDGWKLAGRQLGVFIGIVVAYVLLSIVVGIVPLIGSLAIALLQPVFDGGIMLGCDALRRGEPLRVGHLFAGFDRHAGKLIALGAVKLAAIVVMLLIAFLVVGSSMFSLFAGGGNLSPDQAAAIFTSVLLFALIMLALSVPVYMALWFAPSLIVLGEFDVMPALKLSFNACLKNILPFLVWGIVFFVLAIVASIPLMLGWLLLGPVLFSSVYVAYREIFHSTGAAAD